jgi:hypothetical protein
MAVGQDAAHDVEKAATKTGHVVRHTTKKVVKVTKRGSKALLMEPRLRPKTPEKVSRPVQRKLEKALRTRGYQVTEPHTAGKPG